MSWVRGMALAVVVGGMAGGAFGVGAGGSREEIEAFNKRYVELHLKMDTAGIFATWAEDGVSLMPGEAPLIGKKAIVVWVENILADAGIQSSERRNRFSRYTDFRGLGLGMGYG